LSETNAVLREEIRIKDENVMTERRERQARIDALEREKSNMNTTLISLETQLSSAPSQSLVENMKRELRILKRLEYNADDVDLDRDPEIAGQHKEDEQDLEAVLVAKLRKAEKELISERNGRMELTKAKDLLKEELEKSETALKESAKLVASLEKDLERAIATPFADDSAKDKAKNFESLRSQDNPDTLQHILDPSVPMTTSKATPPPSTAAASEKAEDDHSVATIVMAQRDRLRVRCEALEAERDSFKRELQVQVQSAESLKSDNTKLYEKVRYLQNYSKGSGKAYQRAPAADRDLDLEALEQRYEASVDPFKQFSKSERQRKLQEMSPVERTVFVVAKSVLCKLRASLMCVCVCFVYLCCHGRLRRHLTNVWS
jgi:homeobox protein cut-like